MLLNNRRTQIVLAILVVAMTLAAGLLLLLEPGPMAPRIDIRLASIQPAAVAEKTIFDTQPGPTPERWSVIVIHDSGARQGSAESVNQAHQAMGLGGLAYHFVIGNGRGAGDGEIEVSFRWTHQQSGAFGLAGPHQGRAGEAIGICLIGDSDETAPTALQLDRLAWLVRQLQDHFGIPRERVLIQTGSGSDPEGAGMFPSAVFQSRLLGF